MRHKASLACGGCLGFISALLKLRRCAVVQRHMTIRTFGGAIQVQDAPVAIETNKIRALGLHQDPVYLLVRDTSSTLTNRRISIRRGHGFMICGRCGRAHGPTEMRLCLRILIGNCGNLSIVSSRGGKCGIHRSFMVQKMDSVSVLTGAYHLVVQI